MVLPATHSGYPATQQRNKVSFAAAPWREVSDAAKDVIRRCLDKEPKRRISAEAALQHEWVREGSGVATDRALDPEVLSRMRTFAGMQRLKKLGLMVRSPETKEDSPAPLMRVQVFRALSRWRWHAAVARDSRI